jgi:putative membrane protein
MGSFDFFKDARPGMSDYFSWMRTAMAMQRTLMAAARTSVSLIGFGFTVAQFFERMQRMAPESARITNPGAPRNLGLILIAAGVINMAIFIWQFHRSANAMRSSPFEAMGGASAPALLSASYMISIAVTLIGLVAFFSVFAHL